MRSTALGLALLLLLVAVAGGAVAGKPTVAPQRGHAQGGTPPPPAPAPSPAPVPAPSSPPQLPEEHLIAPAPEPAAAPAPDPEPAASNPTTSTPETPKPIASSTVWRLHDPTIDPGVVQESAAPVVLAATQAPIPAGASPWLAALLGVVAVGAVFAVGARPLGVPRVPKAAPKVHLNLVPIDVPSLLRAAQTAVKEGKLAEALAWLDTALVLDPRLHVAHFCRGVCLSGLDRHAEARAALARAVELEPTEGAYRFELARSCARVGESAEAMAQLAPILAALPELAQDVSEDDAFAGLKDHPQFLALVGLL